MKKSPNLKTILRYIFYIYVITFFALLYCAITIFCFKFGFIGKFVGTVLAIGGFMTLFVGLTHLVDEES